MKKTITYLFIFTFIILMFFNTPIIFNSTIEAVNIWLYKVFPFLFIMIIINNLLINTGFSNLFKNPSIYVMVMSILSGTPTSAYITANLVKQKKITTFQGENILLFSYFANPLFLYSMLFSLFNNLKIVIKIMVIHYLSNILIFIFTKKSFVNEKHLDKVYSFNISSAIKESINTNLMVLGSICFYLIFSNILIKYFLINSLSIFLRGFLEMTQGLNYLTNYIGIKKELLAILFISFGGLSIHTQVKCILDEANINYKYFLKGRIIQIIISLFLYIMVLYI